jgi:hypothetical protein
VNDHRRSDDVLRQAFQSLPVSPVRECAPDDTDRVWRALTGELPAAERRRLVARLASDPALAEVWRIAEQVQRTAPASVRAPSPSPGSNRWAISWIAAAAMLTLAVATSLILRRDGSNEPAWRDSIPVRVESLVSAGAELPRDAFRLRWSAGGAGARYDVRVTTEDLTPVATATDLGEPEVTVDPARLSGVPGGSRILWQVETLLPGGERIVSPTFVVRIAR